VRPSVTITGVGLFTPLGRSAASTWELLIRGGSIREHTKLDILDAPGIPRVTALARHAATEAVHDAGWSRQFLESPSTALIVATSKGPVEEWLVGNVGLDGIAGVAGGIAAGLEMGNGPRLTISAACSSGLHAIIRAALMLQSGEADRVLVVGAEASVHPLFVGSFRRLGVLPPEGYGCRPFDVARKGFLMSDASAAICLERNATAPLVHVDGFAMGADATHITGTDPSGAALRRLLKQVIDCGNPIEVVHGHGTGTIANDAIELSAIDDAVAGMRARPSLYSHKGAIGHSLGAAGLVSIAINCLMHRNGIIPPNVNLNDPLPARNVDLRSSPISRQVDRSIAIAAGFGGPVAVVALASGHT
jgi:3-oxoacyl-[acyl-carrier-protein] synthase II